MRRDIFPHPPKIIAAEIDDEAVGAAMPFVNGHDVELWHLDRRVALLRHIK
jgi:hypothetical protein